LSGELEELEAAAITAECRRRAAVDPWIILMQSAPAPISGGAPEHCEPTEADWREDSDMVNRIDAVERADTARQWYERNPSFSASLEREAGPAVG
jgi:hypothetical protein